MDTELWTVVDRNGKRAAGKKEAVTPPQTAVTSVNLNYGKKNAEQNHANRTNMAGTGRVTEYPNPDAVDVGLNTRQRRTVRASFMPNQGPYGRDKFSAHLISLNLLEHLETCGATAQRNSSTLTFDTIAAAEKFKQPVILKRATESPVR